MFLLSRWAMMKTLAFIMKCNFDFTSDVVYQHFIDYYIDESSFMDFYIANLYVNNFDWLGNNVRLWRTREADSEQGPLADGKWRFILHDTDAGLKDQNIDMLGKLLLDESSGKKSVDPYNYWATLMFRRMASNPNFVEKFKNRMIYHLNSTYEKQHVLETLEKYSDIQEPSIAEHKARWSQTIVFPYTQMIMNEKSFISTRQEKLLYLMNFHLKTGASKKVELSGFNKISNAFVYFGDEKMRIPNKDESFKIYTYTGSIIKIEDASDEVKGYYVGKNEKYEYISGNEIEIKVGKERLDIIPVTFLLQEYIFSPEGITLALVIIILVFVLIIETIKRRKKRSLKWK